MEKKARLGDVDSLTTSINNAYSTSNQEATLAIFEANANISRGVSYTKPRTITLDTKYEGVVNINVWTGYAVNVVSKTGERETVIGPASRILNYDETLETIKLSTGTPKTLNNTVDTVYLRLENNKIADSFIVQTKDFVNVRISLNSLVSFLPEHKDKWFSIENYVHYFCLREGRRR
jgi:major vault protein